ncbi:MAG: hypothetical protein J5776_01695 [Clostridiales bacterium]|nr:hypothetical protein [Clostridiales bacterium]
MITIGIDIGSTYTKYCIKCGDDMKLFMERTPVKQKEYFDARLKELLAEFPDATTVSCGYGQHNIGSHAQISELSALAEGAALMAPDNNVILDIGGQDTKIIVRDGTKLKEFFVNDKCAAGCGIFAINTLNQLGFAYEDIDLRGGEEPSFKLSSTCAVFAQTEIVSLLAKGTEPSDIMTAVIWQILEQSKVLLRKVRYDSIALSGGLTLIKDIDKCASKTYGADVVIPDNSAYLSAIGAALYAERM